MPNMSKDQSDAKKKKRMDMERNLTIITMVLVCKHIYIRISSQPENMS